MAASLSGLLVCSWGMAFISSLQLSRIGIHPQPKTRHRGSENNYLVRKKYRE
jgi:hypothetical protein